MAWSSTKRPRRSTRAPPKLCGSSWEPDFLEPRQCRTIRIGKAATGRPEGRARSVEACGYRRAYRSGTASRSGCTIPDDLLHCALMVEIAPQAQVRSRPVAESAEIGEREARRSGRSGSHDARSGGGLCPRRSHGWRPSGCPEHDRPSGSRSGTTARGSPPAAPLAAQGRTGLGAAIRTVSVRARAEARRYLTPSE
jgi:hypothetical protein